MMRKVVALCFIIVSVSYGTQSFDQTQNRQLIREIMQKHEEQLKHAPRIKPSPKNDDPTPILIIKEGYDVEKHTVVTDDCYILEMHRIPRGRNQDKDDQVRPAVFVQHGLLCSSADWVMGTRDNSLGFMLADAGYDVWLGNYRGNTYSRAHCSLNPRDKEFWQFSWDEHGIYDIPAMIDHITATTGQEKIFYIGHSMGTTGFMVMANERPDMQEKIHMANLLAPVAYVDHMKSPIRYLAPFSTEIAWIANFLGGGEFLPSNFIMDILADLVCGTFLIEELCESVLFVLCGFDQAQMNATMLETIVHHTPAGTSTNAVIHYAQEVQSGLFTRFDYGKDGNNELYGQDTPPELSIEAITIPVASYWSQNDWLAQPQDVLRFLSKVPHDLNLLSYEVPFEAWNHLDYLWGIDAKDILYPKIIETMDNFQKMHHEI